MKQLFTASERIEPGQKVEIVDGLVRLARAEPEPRRFLGGFLFSVYAMPKGSAGPDFEADYHPMFAPDVSDALNALTDEEKRALIEKRRAMATLMVEFFASIDRPDSRERIIPAGGRRK